MDAVGLTVADLFDEDQRQTARNTISGSAAEIEAQYLYAGGNLRKTKRRNPDGSKTFYWSHRKDGRWAKGRANIAPGLYQSRSELPEIVFLVEGEKDVESLDRAGVGAVSLPDGAQSKWDDSYADILKGKRVIIIPDNDDPGRNFATMCAEKLHQAAVAVFVLDLREAFPELPAKGDITDAMESVGNEEAMRRLSDLQRSASPWEPPAPKAVPLLCAADVEYSPPKWLISPYFQRGKGTLIQADPGTGKTAFMCAIAASVTTGIPILGLTVETPGNVLMLSVEDDLGVLRGRISANNGNPDRVFFMPSAANMTINSPEIEQAIKQINAKLLIFDPLQAFLGAGIDMFRANETRPALAKLFEVCERNDCACAVISHMGKSSLGKSPVNQSLGSVDIPAAMRSVLHIARNPNDNAECIAVHVKSSNAPKGRSIAYEIVDRGGVSWHGFCDFTAEDLTAAQNRASKGVPYEREPLVQVFNQLITDNPAGGFFTYAYLKEYGAKLLGFPPFSSSRDLLGKMNGALLTEMQKRDGLIITCGCKQNGDRGVKVERYCNPVGYQAIIRE